MSGFSLRRAAAVAPAGPTDPKPGMPPGQWLQAHRYTVLAAGGIGVVALALISRYRNQGDPSSDPSELNPYLAGQYADTTSTDVYNALEPLLEQLSGFDGTSQLLGQGQSILDAINKLPKPSTTGTTTGGGSTGGTTGGTTDSRLLSQFHQVGKVGATTSLDAYIKKLYPAANSTQLNAVKYWTTIDPRNAQFRSQLQAGKIPGGAPIHFLAGPTYGRSK